jgi:type VI secretion system protein ImpB
MAESFQNEVPRAQKKVELPLKLLAIGDYSNGQDTRTLAERQKVSINKNNFNSVLTDLNPKARIAVENTLVGDGTELPVDLDFKSMDDFKPEVVAGKVPELRALMAARNLLRDLKSNLLDNAMFRRELEKILKDPTLSERLRADLQTIGEAAPASPSAQ